MNNINKIFISFILILFVLLGVFNLKADNVNNSFYNNKITLLKTQLSNDAIQGYSFAYGLNSEQCFSILIDNDMGNSQYLNCKVFIDDLHLNNMDEL
jgi:hypothetical protein